MTRIEKQALKKRKNFGEGGMVEGNSVGGVIADVIIVIILTIVAFAAVVPLWHTLMSSISDGRTLFRTEGLVALPVGKATLDGYALTLKDSSILRAYGNTLIYVIGSTAFGFVLNVIGGYVLSRKFKLRSTLMMLITLTVLFSGGTIPLYMVVRRLGMVGTRWALMQDYAFSKGLSCKQVPITEESVRAELEAGHLLVCSMGPGDFTIQGHFIVITGTEGDGFRVHDPNSRANTARTWTFEEMRHQIWAVFTFAQEDLFAE